jgi:peptidoglycan/xylan/chitin deacetylase (PgdA/CDA1 family)
MALTFDDGPTVVDALISALRNASAPGTFFFIGQNVASNPAAAKRVYDAGFGVRHTKIIISATRLTHDLQ